MYLLVDAEREWSPSYERPNPNSSLDWCPLDDVDPFNDKVVSITAGRDIDVIRFIESGVRSEHVFAIDGETKDIQWMFARDGLIGVLNTNGGP